MDVTTEKINTEHGMKSKRMIEWNRFKKTKWKCLNQIKEKIKESSKWEWMKILKIDILNIDWIK